MALEPADEQIVAYLLGELSGGEREDMQAALFANPALLDRVREVEDDLIDALARGELPEAEAAKVREFAAATGQQDRLLVAAALARATLGEIVAQAPAAVPRTRPGWVSLTGALALACGVLSVSTASLWMQSRVVKTAAVRGTAAIQPGGLYSFAVRPGTVRGGEGPPRIQIPPGTTAVEIELQLEGDSGYATFSVEVRTAAGVPVWNQSGPFPNSAGRVSLLIPARVLTAGAYEAALSGTTSSGRADTLEYYYFRVE